MDINEIKDKIKGFLVDEMEIDPGKIAPEARLKEDLGIDSLEVVDIATVADFNAMPGQSAFDVIDETLYGQPPFASMEQKVEWVCRNFSSTQTTFENDQEWKARRMEADNR